MSTTRETARKAQALMEALGLAGYAYSYWQGSVVSREPDEVRVWFRNPVKSGQSFRTFPEPVEWADIEAHIRGEAAHRERVE